MTINGHTISVAAGGVDDYLGVGRFGMTTIMDSAIPSAPHLTTEYILDNTLAGYTLPFAPSSNMSTPFSATGNAHVAFFAVFAPGAVLAEQVLFNGPNNSTRVDVTVPGSAVPEPLAWTMLLTGFAAIGAALRSRSKARPAELR